MTQVCASVIIALAFRIIGLHIVHQPQQMVLAIARTTIAACSLHHHRIAREVAALASAGSSIYYSIETIVESPEQVSARQQSGLNAVATVPSVCACKHFVVELIFVGIYIAVVGSIHHFLKLPRLIYRGSGKVGVFFIFQWQWIKWALTRTHGPHHGTCQCHH